MFASQNRRLTLKNLESMDERYISAEGLKSSLSTESRQNDEFSQNTLSVVYHKKNMTEGRFKQLNSKTTSTRHHQSTSLKEQQKIFNQLIVWSVKNDQSHQQNYFPRQLVKQELPPDQIYFSKGRERIKNTNFQLILQNSQQEKDSLVQQTVSLSSSPVGGKGFQPRIFPKQSNYQQKLKVQSQIIVPEIKVSKIEKPKQPKYVAWKKEYFEISEERDIGPRKINIFEKQIKSLSQQIRSLKAITLKPLKA